MILFAAVTVTAQERSALYGKVIKADSVLENVHVRNVTTGKFTLTNEQGLFFLNSQAGDTLLLSHVTAPDLVRILDEEDMAQVPLLLAFKADEFELDEVILNEHSEINAVSLGIIPRKIEKLTINERRLKTAGDFKPKHLLGLLVGSLQIEPIFNAISGRTKKLKENLIIEQKHANVSYLQN